MTRMLVPTDFSEPSLAAVRYSLELAAAVGGVVVLLHVVEGPSACSYAVGGPLQPPRDYLDPGGDFFRSLFDRKLMHRDLYEEARWKLESLFTPGCQDLVRTVVTVGKAADEIVRVAKEQQVDLILLGIRGRRRWWRVFHRTVADTVRRKAMVPVIAVDTSDRRVERTPEHSGVLDRCTGGDRAVFHSAERLGVVKDMEPSCYLSTVAATSGRREEAPMPSRAATS